MYERQSTTWNSAIRKPMITRSLLSTNSPFLHHARERLLGPHAASATKTIACSLPLHIIHMHTYIYSRDDVPDSAGPQLFPVVGSLMCFRSSAQTQSLMTIVLLESDFHG